MDEERKVVKSLYQTRLIFKTTEDLKTKFEISTSEKNKILKIDIWLIITKVAK